jgi:hypothetical protein
VDHSPRHYANSNPIRYAPTPRVGMCNYAPCADYDYYGHDQRSYSTSFSTSEIFQPPQQAYMSTYAQPGYQMNQGGYANANNMPQQQAQQQYSAAAAAAANSSPYNTYNYGYRPNSNGAGGGASGYGQPGPSNYRNY